LGDIQIPTQYHYYKSTQTRTENSAVYDGIRLALG